MPLLSRRIPYDRPAILKRAASLEGGWRWRKALALYRQILAAEPRCAEIHLRAAPLLARSRRFAEAWESFEIAASAAEDADRRKVMRAAVKALPRHFEACREGARVLRAHSGSEKALEFLKAASVRVGRGGTRGQAILLLRDAREIAPWDTEVVLSLVRLLRRDGQRAEALFLLDQLESRVGGEDLKAVRFQQWRIEPSLRHTWRWLTASPNATPRIRVRGRQRVSRI